MNQAIWMTRVTNLGLRKYLNLRDWIKKGSCLSLRKTTGSHTGVSKSMVRIQELQPGSQKPNSARKRNAKKINQELVVSSQHSPAAGYPAVDGAKFGSLLRRACSHFCRNATHICHLSTSVGTQCLRNVSVALLPSPPRNRVEQHFWLCLVFLFKLFCPRRFAFGEILEK